MRKGRFILVAGIVAMALVVSLMAYAEKLPSPLAYVPVVRNQDTMVEFRGLWVTRFDWTLYNQPADPAKIDEIVNNAAAAGFNAIFFQVRGTADAYYAPGPEPWAKRVSGGVLGQPPNPYWDPLAYFVQQAHAQGLELHAYINVYPLWDVCSGGPPATTPTHLYDNLAQVYGETNNKLNAVQWDGNGNIHCSVYQRVTPAAAAANDHYLAVAQYLVDNYEIDGLHLDNIRYGGSVASCDPVSAAAAGVPCFSTPPAGYGSYEDWQRQQIDDLVARFYNEIVLHHPDLWLSAAVWPVYIQRPEWGWPIAFLEGYFDFYQDSKAWVQDGVIDSISPMIYPGTVNCPDNSVWTLDRWQTLVEDYQIDRAGRYVVPGIGGSYCTFDEITNRIDAARAAGTAGHAIFSYGGLKANAYFDDLAAGPYHLPALIPEIPWH